VRWGHVPGKDYRLLDSARFFFESDKGSWNLRVGVRSIATIF